MKIKPRYGLLLAAGLIVISGLVYATVEWRVELRCERDRLEGVTALQQGKFALATERLGRRLSQTACGAGDPDTLYDFARARARVPEPGAAHIVESVAALKNAVISKPDHVEAWRDLSLAWLGMGKPERAVDAARKAVALSPTDHHAQRLLLTGLLASRREREALEISQQALQSEPGRWWLHLARLSALAAKTDTKALTPADPSELGKDQAVLVEAYVDILNRRFDAARRKLAVAASTDGATEPLFMETIANLALGVGLQTETLGMLHRHRAQLSGKLRATYVDLAWQSGRIQWVLDYLAQSPPITALEPGLILVHAMACRAAGLLPCTAQDLFTVAGSAESEADRRWRRLVAAVLDNTQDAEVADAAEEVLEIDPGNPTVMQVAAGSWLRLGEPRRAAAMAARAMTAAPAWALPALTRAQALLRTGNPLLALESAREAARRSPADPQAGLTLARAWALTLGDGDEKAARGLLELISALETRVGPGKRGDVAPMRMIANARLGAMTAVDDGNAVHFEIAGPRTRHADRGSDISDNELTAVEPDSRRLPDSRSRSGVSSEARRCESEIDHGRHSDCWRALLTRHPADLNTHLLALAAAVAREDPVLQREVVDRLTGLTPATSAVWRLARARMLLTSEATEKSAAEAALLLRYILQRVPDQPDAHLLMAGALAQLRDRPGVGAHLLEAAQADPRRVVDALKMSLYLAREVLYIEPRILVSWWESLTRIEYEYIVQSKQLPGQRSATDGGAVAQSIINRLGLLASFAEAETINRLAENVYRRILQLDPDAHVASNNLAMILSTEGRSLDEALALANRTLDLKPESSDYQDTLRVVERAIELQRATSSQIGGS